MATAKKAKSKPGKKTTAKKPAGKKKTAAKKVTPRKAPAKKPALKKTAAKKKSSPSPAAKKAAAKPPAMPRPAASTPAAPAAAPRQKLPAVALSAVAVAPRGMPHSNAAAAAAVPDHSPLPGEDPVGVVTHYFSHLSVAVVELDTGSLQVGDSIRIIGHTTDLRQTVESLEVEHQSVTEVGRRQAFGMKVKAHVREHDVVYKVNEF